MRVAIVGAGMAGLACAEALGAALGVGGTAVVLFDKGRAPGGRMSTRRVTTDAGEASFDHGAQYFTARDPAFRARVDGWQRTGLAAPWPAAGPDAWVGTPGMTAPARAMAAALDVRAAVQVGAMERDQGGWRLEGERFDAVVLAVPAEQAAPLLQPWQPAFAAIARATPAAPCWTLMAAFAERLSAPDVLRDKGPIAWAARNSAKPGRQGPEAWVVQAGPQWTADHLELTAADVAPLLLAAFGRLLGTALPEPLSASAHRWRYARSGTAGQDCLWDAGQHLGVCGDWLIGPRVEAAWLSGTRLAAAVTGATPHQPHPASAGSPAVG